MSYAHRIVPGQRVSLKDIDPDERGPFSGKQDPAMRATQKRHLEQLSSLQELLFAEKRHAVLMVLQATDTAGKDGVLRHVVGPLDSRGIHVHSFKPPSEEEKAHDFLWRAHVHTPRLGDMTFFNRSHYEDVLVVRVLDLVPKSVWKRRYEHINAFEKMLTDAGTRILKIFLHISKEEQKRRLEERLENPDKRWKWDPGDLEMRAHWDEFQTAYEDMLEKTSTDWAPWHVVPANRKWFRDLTVAETLVHLLKELDPRPPYVSLDPSKIVIPD